jgi:hypothetical protein
MRRRVVDLKEIMPYYIWHSDFQDSPFWGYTEYQNLYQYRYYRVYFCFFICAVQYSTKYCRFACSNYRCFEEKKILNCQILVGSYLHVEKEGAGKFKSFHDKRPWEKRPTGRHQGLRNLYLKNNRTLTHAIFWTIYCHILVLTNLGQLRVHFRKKSYTQRI